MSATMATTATSGPGPDRTMIDRKGRTREETFLGQERYNFVAPFGRLREKLNYFNREEASGSWEWEEPHKSECGQRPRKAINFHAVDLLPGLLDAGVGGEMTAVCSRIGFVCRFVPIREIRSLSRISSGSGETVFLRNTKHPATVRMCLLFVRGFRISHLAAGYVM